MVKKTKSIMLIIVVSILLLVLIILGITGMSKNKKKTEEPKKADTILKDVKSGSPCYNETNCLKSSGTMFALLESEIKNEEVQEWIQKTNEKTQQYYRLVQSSTTDDPACVQVKDVYKHSVKYGNVYTIKDEGNYSTISVKRFKENLCTNEKEDFQIEVLIYNKEKKKVISQIEWMQELGISDEVVGSAIESNINMINKNGNLILSLDNAYQKGKHDYMLYYGKDGKLLVSYFQKEHNLYYAAIIR